MKETKQFQTESKELLNLMINSIYSNNEIFLRELISNASDAIDKYRFMALNSGGKIPLKDFVINVKANEKKRTITISDNGIGMNKEDLISCLQERNVIDELLNDPTVRNTIYMQEKAKRDKKERERAARGRKFYQEILDGYGE